MVIPHAPKWHQRILAALIFALARSMAATLRFKLNDESGYFSDEPQEKIIFAIWHNRLALALTLYRRYVMRRDPDRQLVALVSASRDGGLLGRSPCAARLPAGARRRCANWCFGAGAATIWPSRPTARAVRAITSRTA